MAEEQQSEAAAPDQTARARELGWSPQDEWRGAPEKWVDAETFVKRGEEFIPFLKASKKDLESKLQANQAEIRRLSDLYAASQEAIEALRDHQTEATKRAVADARSKLKAELIQAKKDGDVEKEVEVSDQMRQLDGDNATIIDGKKTKSPAAAPATAPSPASDPEYIAWQNDNAWFMTDVAKQGAAISISNQMRADPALAALRGRAFLDEVTKRVNSAFGSKAAAPPKVEGGGAGPSGSGATSGKRTFNDLPIEAKQVCDKQSAKLVGKGRAFETRDQWRAHYVEQYFIGEMA